MTRITDIEMVRTSIVIQGALNGAMECVEVENVKMRIMWAKWLINKFPDTNVRIDVDLEYEKFMAWYYEVTHIECEEPRI
jgi:hypothetical protein